MRKKKKPVRLQKKKTLTEKFQNWINRNKTTLIIFLFAIMFAVMFMFIYYFSLGTESGIWYNGGVENVV